MNLKDKLFPDRNISEHWDSLGELIKAGDKLMTKEGGPWYVHLVDQKFYVSLEEKLDNPNHQKMALTQWLLLVNEPIISNEK